MTTSTNSPYEVHVLFNGYSTVLDTGGMRANCSCTLITGGEHKIIVDTMTAWDGDRIVEALSKHNVTCQDISYVICTHGHSDHIGNNNLFKSATHIVGYSISEKGDLYHDPQFEDGEDYIIDDFIKVTPTPGHTLTDVSVLVETKDNQLIAIAGDLFEREEDLLDDTIWLELAGSEDDELQRTNRNKILLLADYIVPGHGPMFKVTESMKREARESEDLSLSVRPIGFNLALTAGEDDDIENDDDDDDDTIFPSKQKGRFFGVS
uniref:Metallo-beta-lactamase domain-containing protein 1 n=1 Tax=Cacopsylla melanoneura TaxID=428564 RepID=A0A8D8WDH3_9HEMI